MNIVLRKLLLPLPGLVRWYLSSKRSCLLKGLTLEILPGVFHPGLFFSSRLLADYLETLPLSGSTVLEIGSGSGFISLVAAQKGAYVTSIDITAAAVENTQINAAKNRLTLQIMRSDLFLNLPFQTFDWIFINPPYYPRTAVNPQDFAWYCGEGHEYFARLFKDLKPHLKTQGQAVMVLSEVCDLPAIMQLATDHHLIMKKVHEKKVWADGQNYIYLITPAA